MTPPDPSDDARAIAKRDAFFDEHGNGPVFTPKALELSKRSAAFQAVVRLYKRGKLRQAAIARRLGISRRWVCVILQRAGITKQRKRMPSGNK